MARRLPRALLAVWALSLVAACGGDSPREQVADYIRAANAHQQAAAPAIDRANKTYAAFAGGDLPPGEAAGRLGESEAALRALQGRLEALAPPAPARGLHRQLLRVYAGNVAFAHDTTRLARYTPAAQEALEPLDRANRRLVADLRGTRAGATQSRAVRRFAASLAAIVGDLRALDPPPVLAPSHRAQIRRLSSTRRLAARLASALAREDAKAVARRLIAFRRAARPDRATDRAQRAALRAYGARADELSAAYTDLQRRHSRLNGTLD